MTARITRRTALAGLSAFAAAPAFAQSGGSTITMMHGFTPGANVDIVARLIADQLGKRLNRQIVVEPRPGAGGTTSAAAVARADPDGTTLTILPGGHAVSAAIYKQLPYNAVDSFSFISMLTDFPFILVTYPDHPAKTVADVIRSGAGRARQAQLRHGRQRHRHASGVRIVRGDGECEDPARAVPRLAAGHHRSAGQRVDFQVDTPAVLMPPIRMDSCARSRSPDRRRSSCCRTCRQ